MTPPPIRSAAIIGLGAIGILYAAQISKRTPSCLRIIADPARIARYKTDPPTFNGTRLDLNYVTPAAPGGPADLVLVAVKSTSLAAVLPSIAPFVSDTTQILPLLNGISAQDTLAAAFGWPRVLHGFVYCSSSMRTGNAVIQNGVNKIVFGEPTNSPPPPRVQAIPDCLERLGITHATPPDIRTAQWKKFILNIGINQTQALLRAPCRELQENPEAMQLALDLMNEAAAIATALGIPNADQLPAWAESVIRAAAPENKTSMLQDIEAGRPPETDLFAATICRRGRELNIPTPANARALRLLQKL